MRSHFESTGDRPALQPEVKMTNEDWKEGEDVEVSMTYEALPQVPDVDFQRDRAREARRRDRRRAPSTRRWHNLAASAKNFDDRPRARQAKDGDQVVIDFLGSVDGEPFDGGSAEDFPLVLGSGNFIPGFEEQLVGAKAGDARDVKVTFPEAYGAPNLAGKAATFAVTVKAVKASKPAEIDDALATRFGAESLDALKENIRGRLADEYAQASRAILKRRLMDALDAQVSFELPPTLVDVEARQIAHQLWHEEHHDHHGHDHDEIDADRRAPQARRAPGAARPAPRRDRQQARHRRARPGVQRALFEQARQYPGQERQFLEFVQKNPQALQQIRAPLFEEQGRRLHPRARPADREAGEKGRAAEGDRGARRGCRNHDRAGAGRDDRGLTDAALRAESGWRLWGPGQAGSRRTNTLDLRNWLCYRPARRVPMFRRSSVVEQLTVNQLVVGSNPTAGANKSF